MMQSGFVEGARNLFVIHHDSNTSTAWAVDPKVLATPFEEFA